MSLKKCSKVSIFTFASDGTSRAKQHYMEKHIVLDDGSMMSLGFTELATDDAKSLLEQTMDILDELIILYCCTL